MITVYSETDPLAKESEPAPTLRQLQRSESSISRRLRRHSRPIAGFDRSYAAQQPMSEAERRAKRVADMTKELGLTPDQSAKMDEIIKDAQVDVGVVREKARSEMRAILTDEQKPKFEAMVQRRDAERKKAQQRMGK